MVLIRMLIIGKNYIMNLDYYHSHKTDEQGNKVVDEDFDGLRDLLDEGRKIKEEVDGI